MYRKTDDQPRRDPYQDVTDRILEALEAGTRPWIRPWNADQAEGPQSPFNPTTSKHYRGINVLLLSMDPRAFMSGDPRSANMQPRAAATFPHSTMCPHEGKDARA